MACPQVSQGQRSVILFSRGRVVGVIIGNVQSTVLLIVIKQIAICVVQMSRVLI